MKKLLLLGYFGFDNSGDDAILKAMVENLHRIDNNLELTALSKDPIKTRLDYNIKTADRFSYKSLKEEIKNTDILVFGGGSLLQDITSSRSLYYYLWVIRMALMEQKPVFVFANGIGPIRKAHNRRLTRNILNKVDLITLRDQTSYNFISSIGVDTSKAVVTADPVFLINPSGEDGAGKILREQNIKLSKNVVGISLRNWKESENLAEEVAKFCDKLKDKDLDFLIVPMHYPYDVDYCKKVKEYSSNPRVHVIDTKYDVADIISLLERCKVVFAMRLHALIYAAKANVPIISLIYDPKVTGLSKDLGIKENIMVEDATADIMYEKFNELMDSYPERLESIRRANKIEEQKSLETIKLLEELIYKND